MNALAAAALAAGELVCEFNDGYRRSLLAAVAGEPPKTELLLVYEDVGGKTDVLSSRRPGRRRVLVREGAANVYLIEADGPSLRVTTLTGCTRVGERDGVEHCTRFSARHAWHFDAAARTDPDKALSREPSGAASGVCEPWRVD